MSAVLAHLMWSRVPLTFALTQPLVALGTIVAIARGVLDRRIWWLVVGMQALLVASALVAIRTGEEVEEELEPAVPEALVEAHAESAEFFAWVEGAVLVASLVGGVLPKRRARLASSLAVAGLWMGAGLAYRTGTQGRALVVQHAAALSGSGTRP